MFLDSKRTCFWQQACKFFDVFFHSFQPEPCSGAETGLVVVVLLLLLGNFTSFDPCSGSETGANPVLPTFFT